MGMKIEIENIVAFCILMENNDGILGKAPSYIIEKYCGLIEGNTEYPENFLDFKNKAKFDKWKEKWRS